jgi:hypothetical protein
MQACAVALSFRFLFFLSDNNSPNSKNYATQLKGVTEYLADADERRGLIAYMQKGESSTEVRERL